MNQVSIFVGKISKLKLDVINYHDGCFQYRKKGPEIIFPGINIPHKIDVPAESNNSKEEDLSKNILYLFLKITRDYFNL